MKISVILTTHNRADKLKIALTRLLNQAEVDFEIIVVDDGSTDHTAKVAKQFPIRYIFQKNAGQGAARNRGVKEAQGELILFGQDDIWVEPGFLKAHVTAHQKHPDETVLVLGFSTWSPQSKLGANGGRMGDESNDEWQAVKEGPLVDVNDYMKFLERSGWQFGYGFLKPGFVTRPEAHKFFYTSNISLKKSLFQKEHFDEAFKVYGWEDIEWGYRLIKNQGAKLFYEPEAKAYHHHFIAETDLPKKMQRVGESAVAFQKLHPELQVLPRRVKKWLIKAATNPLTLPLTRMFGKQMYFKFSSWREFWKGVGRAKNG